VTSQYQTLPANSNQALGIANYAISFLRNDQLEIDPAVLKRVEAFHRDSVACGIAALAIGAVAPTVLREEALDYALPSGTVGAKCFGTDMVVSPEKAVLAGCSAVRELDANGTNFGYNSRTDYQRGEFGHNDFYPVVVAAAQASERDIDGEELLRAMLCLDEIRGRLAEVFGLKDYKIDHVVHGGIASAAVYGAMVGASAAEIESAIGMLVAHYIPFRAIRAGHQLSDSKGASAAITAEVAVQSVRRSMKRRIRNSESEMSFVGPADILRNPQAIFCLFEPQQTSDTSPFDLELAISGSDFAIMQMHFKLGLYEHQSAGAIFGLLKVLSQLESLPQSVDSVQKIDITIYEPAYGIICDPAKLNPTTRQSADHSMLYILATVLRKAIKLQSAAWEDLMLLPADYDEEALFEPITRQLMSRIELHHGGKEFDAMYPEGIPTQIKLALTEGGAYDSGLMMFPPGHARNLDEKAFELLDIKFQRLVELAGIDPVQLDKQLSALAQKDQTQIQSLYLFPSSS
jgi:2-methylcitrate dehydratase